jgi:hypothetical protein
MRWQIPESPIIVIFLLPERQLCLPPLAIVKAMRFESSYDKVSLNGLKTLTLAFQDLPIARNFPPWIMGFKVP